MPPLRCHSWAQAVAKRLCKGEVRKNCHQSTSISYQPRKKQELGQQNDRTLWHPLGQDTTHESARLLQESLLLGQSLCSPITVIQENLQSHPS